MVQIAAYAGGCAGVTPEEARCRADELHRLAAFYQDLFGCVLVPPERDYHGEQLDAGTGLHGARLQGAHLRLPGYGDEGPTLEVYSYGTSEPRPKTAVNRPSYGQIAFGVDDVAAARTAVLDAGGCVVGEVVTLTTAPGTKVTWCYVTDPEGNIIELQSWSR